MNFNVCEFPAAKCCDVEPKTLDLEARRMLVAGLAFIRVVSLGSRALKPSPVMLQVLGCIMVAFSMLLGLMPFICTFC